MKLFVERKIETNMSMSDMLITNMLSMVQKWAWALKISTAGALMFGVRWTTGWRNKDGTVDITSPHKLMIDSLIHYFVDCLVVDPDQAEERLDCLPVFGCSHSFPEQAFHSP